VTTLVGNWLESLTYMDNSFVTELCRDVLYLDLALDGAVRSAVESSLTHIRGPTSSKPDAHEGEAEEEAHDQHADRLDRHLCRERLPVCWVQPGAKHGAQRLPGEQYCVEQHALAHVKTQNCMNLYDSDATPVRHPFHPGLCIVACW